MHCLLIMKLIYSNIISFVSFTFESSSSYLCLCQAIWHICCGLDHAESEPEVLVNFLLGLPLLLLLKGEYWRTYFSDLVSSISSTCLLQFFLLNLIFFTIGVTPSSDVMASELTLSLKFTPIVLLTNFISADATLLLSDFFSA